jgi:predicted TIM-barrel fold metal-dependent hydrolase
MDRAMAELRVIDADTHIDEIEATFDYMLPDEAALKPTIGYYPDPKNPSRPPVRNWVIDGFKRNRPLHDDAKSTTRLEYRTLEDVAGRLRHMDELGTELQVIYPTLFLRENAQRPEVELGIKRSYNRWLADRCAPSSGRLRWVCLPPMMNIDEAVKEVRFAKDHGAVGVLKKGDLEAGRWPQDPYFFPVYEEAERLDMPICFHTGSGLMPEEGATPPRNFLDLRAPVLNAAYSLIRYRVPDRFPKLRFGMVEAASTWVPLVDYMIRREMRPERYALSSEAARPERIDDMPDDLFKANRIYVTCQTDEDFPWILNYISEDNLIVGSDYGHHDQSHQHGFRELLQERVDQGDLPPSALKKIIYDNARVFYAL